MTQPTPLTGKGKAAHTRGRTSDTERCKRADVMQTCMGGEREEYLLTHSMTLLLDSLRTASTTLLLEDLLTCPETLFVFLALATP